MRGYYSRNLSGERLRRCYEVAPPRVQQYLEAEIDFVLGHLEQDDTALELGCGYGRVARRMAEVARQVIGIDTSSACIALAGEVGSASPRCEFVEMDARELAFCESAFDKVVCVQNGICAFGIDKKTLFQEALRVVRPGGCVLVSTYSERFWKDRLEWFEAQAEHGLVGPIDYEKTGDGTIVCEDGFHVGMVSPDQFSQIVEGLGVKPDVTEVDESSVFCEIIAEK